MKLIIFLMGLATLLATAGCEEFEEHEHHEHRGGAYDGYYRGYGHEWHGHDYDDDWRYR